MSELFDLTQEQLANKLGVSRYAIIRIENGELTTDEMVIKIAHFFDKDPSEIFFVNKLNKYNRNKLVIRQSR
ncbi:helix-turn-helix transcriptional regulator [Robertmurraya sp.]|uniref:helix-turn-helix transcriptional regulator n=1 Tax=Robertmurraya sp. TaxID=2837525 RepID=UPI003704164C